MGRLPSDSQAGRVLRPPTLRNPRGGRHSRQLPIPIHEVERVKNLVTKHGQKPRWTEISVVTV